MYKVGFFSANLVHQKRLTANGNRDSPYKVSNILSNLVHREPPSDNVSSCRKASSVCSKVNNQFFYGASLSVEWNCILGTASVL